MTLKPGFDSPQSVYRVIKRILSNLIKRRTRILIADDHPIVRKGIRQILSDLPGETHIEDVGSANNLMKALKKSDFDVIILDISMPGKSGLEIMQDIHRDYPDIPVLILSMHPEEKYALRALKSGASGYLTKDSAPNELTRAVQKVLGGGKYITSSLAEKMADNLLIDPDKPVHHCLSNREYEVLCKIAEGKNMKLIAEELFISEKTVSTYRSRILEKMNMNSNTELIRYAL
ncbi:MAG: response regulator transcription factor [Bacteroidales bacterium]|nr:response regulator transcription factor [Bacteroidales bacterium]